jgi:hypothetical protein
VGAHSPLSSVSCANSDENSCLKKMTSYFILLSCN